MNNSIYKASSLERQIASTGIDSNIDLLKAKEQGIFDSAKSILEVGAGTGRVLGFITCNLDIPHIYAIEHNPEFRHIIQLRYPHVVLIDRPETVRFDVAMVMFSTFYEFNENDQMNLMAYIGLSLNTGGKLVIDNVDANYFKTDAFKTISLVYNNVIIIQLQPPDKTLTLTLQTPKTIEDMAKFVGLKLDHYSLYDLKGLRRYQMIFTKE